jgi:poly(A) polymerase
MLDRAILKPVLPEIAPEHARNLEALIGAERQAEIAPDGLRRLAALLPRDPAIADEIGARLRLSNKARKRLACTATAEHASSPRTLAYRVGNECAVDRLLLDGKPAEAAEIAGWKTPRLPIGGGVLIARGLPEGPVVAQTLKAIEDRWVEAGFPSGPEFEKIVSSALESANR